MKYLLITSLLITQAFAKAPIEGGSSVFYDDTTYVDVVKLRLPNDSGECTGTRVSPTIVLTAAHCVLYFSSTAVIQETIRPGQLMGTLGEVVAVHVHPKYREARKNKVLKKDLLSSKQATLYDIAFIQFKERSSQRTIPYPKIISDSNKPTTRKSFELAGYGGQEAYWDGQNFSSRIVRNNLQVGKNDWVNCPTDYSSSSLAEIEKLTNNVQELLSINSTRVHEIMDGVETLVTDGSAMILSGDSGSPALEKDKDGNLLVTGVASNINPYADGSGASGMVIYKDGKVVAEQKLDEMPDDWGLRGKSSSEFSEVNTLLKNKGLLDSSGKPKSGVQVKRFYTRKTTGNYSDLLHPDNQKFISSVMK